MTDEQLIELALERMDKVPVTRVLCSDLEFVAFITRMQGYEVKLNRTEHLEAMVGLRMIMLN